MPDPVPFGIELVHLSRPASQVLETAAVRQDLHVGLGPGVGDLHLRALEPGLEPGQDLPPLHPVAVVDGDLLNDPVHLRADVDQGARLDDAVESVPAGDWARRPSGASAASATTRTASAHALAMP